MDRLMGTDWVMRKWPLFFAGLIGLAVLAVESTVAHGIADSATMKLYTCSVQGPAFVKSGDVALNIDCNGRKFVLQKASVIVSYLKDPGPLKCLVPDSGRYSCEDRN